MMVPITIYLARGSWSIYFVTVMTHVKVLHVGQSSQGASEHITLVL